MRISQSRLARDINVPPRGINEISLSKRGVTPDTALRLGHYFGVLFWTGVAPKDYHLLPAMVTDRGGQGAAWELRLLDLEGRPQSPHGHVYRDGKLIVKWNLDDRVAMKGRPTARVLRLIAALEREGIL